MTEPDPASIAVRRSGPWLDGLSALIVFAMAGIWGTHYWNASWAAGRAPAFYQEYFEPAVMTACGKGFVVATPPIPAMTDFLAGKRDRIDCRDIPPGVTVRFATFQAGWRYLMVTVAGAWRLLGISWSGLGPLCGALFGIAIALSYGIFRLGMGRLFALGGALMFAISPIQLLELPHLRDYAKAPFALACLLILGVMVRQTLGARAALVLSVIYGTIVGIGYGFRSDLLIYLPPFFITLAAFVPGGVTRNLRRKALQAAACLAAFVLSAMPILSTAARDGSCLWHFALLGFTNTFTENLRLVPGPYDWGHKFSDRWVFGTVSAYAERRRPELGRIIYCSPAYDVAGREYFTSLATTFPADMMTRGLAAISGVIREAFWRPPPLLDFATAVYVWRDRLLRRLPGGGLYWVAAAVLIAAGTGLRVGLFLLLFVVYFCGYPALQFHPRHTFHLEFIPWWAMGFIVAGAGRWIWTRITTGRPSPIVEPAAVRRICVFALASASLFAVTWISLRALQDGNVRRMFDAYIAAPKDSLEYVASAPGALHPVSFPEGQLYPAAFLEIDLRSAACGPAAAVTIRYEPRPDAELSRTFNLPPGQGSPAVTRVFTPVYEFFRGLEFSDERDGCVAGIYRFSDLRSFPVLVNATLTPDWQRQPLHQTMADPWPGR